MQRLVAGRDTGGQEKGVCSGHWVVGTLQHVDRWEVLGVWGGCVRAWVGVQVEWATV